MDILLTNDDGIHATGLRALYNALTEAGNRVRVVAPMTEQSAVGHAVTLSLPLRIKPVRENGFEGLGVLGTPVDCVKLALGNLLSDPPDLVISGINSGANVGVDILYSGTVSAATEGALAGFPAMAVSIDDFNPQDLSGQAEFVADFLTTLFLENIPPRCVLNLNFPNCSMKEAKGLRVCPQTDAVYSDWYDERRDPRGGSYYWLNGQIPPEMVGRDTDRGLLTRKYVTLTPLRFDFTDNQTLERLKSLFPGEG
ncbi:MAG: 5'/3'-nucleotidase SurE [Desulfovibrionales bacterium]